MSLTSCVRYRVINRRKSLFHRILVDEDGDEELLTRADAAADGV